MNDNKYNFVKVITVVFHLMIIALVSCVDNSPIDFNSEQIAIFEKYTNQGVELYSWSAENNAFQSLITLNSNERYELSPDRLQVAIYFADDLSVVDLLTLDEIILSENLTWPTIFIENIEHTLIAWSPDGKKLAVLTGGPSWKDESLSSTSLLIFDVTQQSLEAIINNGTWINDMAWSPNSKKIVFSELQAPCWFIEVCKETDEESSWGLTMAVQLESEEWQVHKFKSFTSPISRYTWQEESICQLSWSPLGTLISYETPCSLSELPRTPHISVSTIDASTSVQRIEQNLDSVDAGYFDMHWLVEENEFIVAFRGDSFGESKHSTSTLSRYLENDSKITLENEKLISEANLSIPLTIDYAPDDLYAIAKLVDGKIMIVQLSDLSIKLLQDASEISFNGVWVSEGYLTQSENKLIIIHPQTDHWEIIRDDIPNDLYLIGWQNLEN